MRSKRQKQRDIPRRRLSEKETRWYFSPRRIPTWIPITFLAGLLLIVIGITSSYFSVFAAGVILCIGSVLWFMLIRTSKPSDAQYDRWLEDQARAMYSKGLRKLGINKRDFSSPPLRIHSVVLPGTRAASSYPSEEVRIWRGKDGELRYCIHVYTYFFFTKNSLAFFKSDINAWNHSEYDKLNEANSYRYHDIIGVTLYRSQDTVDLKDIVKAENSLFQYRIDQLRFELSNGQRMQLSAALRATLSNRYQKAPLSLLPETDFEDTINQLRTLLFSQE